MSGSVRYTPQQADLIAAFRLHYPVFAPKRFTGFLLFSAAVGFAVALASGGNEPPDQVLMVGSMLLFGLIVYVVIQLIVRIWWMPRYTRRIYAQQVELRQPVEISWDDQQFRSSAESGDFRLNWADFHQWKRNEAMLLLYRSEALFNFLALDTDERRAAADAMQIHLIAAGVEERR